ncbi:MAG TPA: hypothetical protein VFF11_13560 [Candidatus Binatia bacterium]|nr:hypothetical protein [Candidatus Binatia bacterium]
MKFTNRKIVCGLLAGAAGLLFVGNANAASESVSGSNMPSCCSATNAATAADAKAKPDLLTTCPVSGEKLGEMDAPYVFTYKGQEVKLCCKDCKKDFDKNPDKYIAKIRAADKKGKADIKK